MTRSSSRIREMFRALHGATEERPLMRALWRGDAPRAQYLGYLRGLSVQIAVLERLVDRSPSPALAAVWREELRKLPWLLADIETLGGARDRAGSAASVAGLTPAATLRVASIRSPGHLLGALYVHEGATNGGVLLADRVAESLGLDGADGTRFLRGHGQRQAAVWEAFRDRLDAAVDSEPLFAEVAEGVRETYLAVQHLLDVAAESHSREARSATWFNPEAGSHAVPDDEGEVRAVEEAAADALEEMPYVEARYGERGVRYTRSDGAWLVTLVRFSQPVVDKQVRWLAQKLSSLGMPRWTLIRHLRLTRRALERHVDPGRERLDVLEGAAAMLEREQAAALPAASRAAATAAFRAELPDHAEGAGFLPIWLSSIADDRIDDHDALSGTLRWVEHASPWPPAVARACRAAMAAAAEHVEGHAP